MHCAFARNGMKGKEEGKESKRNALGACDGQFPRPRHGLHHDVGLLDSRGQEL